MKQRIILAGGSGFLGRALGPILLAKNYEVVVLSRQPAHESGGIRYVTWDGRKIGRWAEVLDNAKAIVNLTGKSVNCRYTSENRREIIESRVDSVRVLGEAIKQCGKPPEVFVQSGSLAIYGNAGDQWRDESSPHGTGFSVDVCERWEKAFDALDLPQTRKSLFRIAFVLARGEGALKILARLTKWFLGGRVGSGRQFISWIHIADLNQMFLWAIERNNISGVFNATSPNPVTNAQFMRELRRALNRPWSPPVPVPLVYIGAWLMRTEASLALSGWRCTPRHFLEQGFQFEFPELRPALSNICGTGRLQSGSTSNV